ncbi:type I secretion system permease/ATPase [Aliirhizobium cellulosilyticum]|uniref:ATP-binding cassette subfamily C protein n=1 Tax=Aliirhizobium cellulosilyticum TaxID=393664 RepID=A0A7W6TFL3_9HYPH|nr:type I secretion system permease/ATPase [Rhizobium cellulosilyticum]MBB4349246.1 ATP-binding cassette subfamily C protein [Rhizobium cellulosilyticum]MBB4412533.1 ATP-binding cassette subfamily C protein [Rhizobium cellulosilyticum]MBB4447165.1 ATP-binding cassette subfamily C protein [Rhizobium cellulosilyticum]
MLKRNRNLSVADAIRTCRSAFWGIFVISAVLNILMLTGPIFMLQVYDRVLSSSSVPTLVVLSMITLSLYLFSGMLDILRSKALLRISMRVYTRLCNPSLRANIRLPVLLGSKGSGVHPGRDLDTIRRFLGSQGPASIFDLPFMPLYFALVFIMHSALGYLALAGGALIFVLVICNEFASRSPTKEVGMRTAAQSKIMDSARRNSEVVNAMGMLGRLSDRFSEMVEPYYFSQQMATDRSNFYSSVIKLLRMILQSAMLALGAYLAIKQEISGGVMIASSIIMARAIAPIEQAVGQWPSFIACRQAAGRLNQVLLQCDVDKGLEGLPLPRQELTVQDAATSAPGEPLVLLQGVEFSLQAGDGLGIIGGSGSGKTSFARALVGVWPVLKGAIRLDGSTIDQWSDQDRGRFIGYLPQDVELFEGTVAENIARFDKDADVVAIVAAAKMAGIHNLIAGLPEGYNTMIGEGGARLSAGQRQRVGLARALFGNPFLVVLDEPNSNLDVEGEQALSRAMMDIRERGGIVVVVAHRASALAAVNKVLIIQNGQQVAFGDKDQVLSNVSMLSGSQQPGKVVANAL